MIRLALAALLLAAPAGAQVYGLTPAEKTQVLDAAALRPDTDTLSLLPPPTLDRRPHGEVSMMIGSGGARGLAGTIGLPIGDNGSAALSFSTARLPGFYAGGNFGRPFAVDQQSFGFRLRQQGW